MGRRTVLLVVAALIAALGTSLVFMYVRGVDARASAEYDGVQVLKAAKIINPGETLQAAQAAGKIIKGTVARGSLLPGATLSTTSMANEVALTTIFPGEQIISGKFGAAGQEDVLTIPDGKMAISVNLTDPARVAGFVTPGADVAIFASVNVASNGGNSANANFTRLLLPRVTVIGVGTTTVVPTTTTDGAGAQTTEQLPKTLLTLAVDQKQAEQVIYASKNGELAFGLLTDKSAVKAGSGINSSNVFK
jgi:pilus assembly protein CpaB